MKPGQLVRSVSSNAICDKAGMTGASKSNPGAGKHIKSISNLLWRNRGTCHAAAEYANDSHDSSCSTSDAGGQRGSKITSGAKCQSVSKIAPWRVHRKIEADGRAYTPLPREQWDWKIKYQENNSFGNSDRVGSLPRSRSRGRRQFKHDGWRAEQQARKARSEAAELDACADSMYYMHRSYSGNGMQQRREAQKVPPNSEVLDESPSPDYKLWQKDEPNNFCPRCEKNVDIKVYQKPIHLQLCAVCNHQLPIDSDLD